MVSKRAISECLCSEFLMSAVLRTQDVHDQISVAPAEDSDALLCWSHRAVTVRCDVHNQTSESLDCQVFGLHEVAFIASLHAGRSFQARTPTTIVRCPAAYHSLSCTLRSSGRKGPLDRTQLCDQRFRLLFLRSTAPRSTQTSFCCTSFDVTHDTQARVVRHLMLA